MHAINISRLVLVALWLCTFGQSIARAEGSCLQYNKDGVVLTGLVFLRTYYGPPNYGELPESDALERQAFLALDNPICVHATDPTYEADAANEDLVTLVPMGEIGFSKYAGKRISVTGSLYSAHTAHHRTTVLIGVQTPPKVLR